MQKYDPKKIEGKWQKAWTKSGIYKTETGTKKPKCYVLDMFPYPSGEGLHVGHPKGYIATDIYSRRKKMNGFNVLHPMGWDAFGLPAENYAIKMKVNPMVMTKKNVAHYKQQLSVFGCNYDWSREINTTDPEYYKWTQWTFIKMFEKGLAYESYEPINWCPSCKTGLALEDLEDGRCERCGSVVEKKPMRQWVLRITDYAERLLKDLDNLNWPESIKEAQRNWIGKSEGAEIQFKIKDEKLDINVFTTRADTLFGCTYVVLAPEHSYIHELEDKIKNIKEVKAYVKKSAKENDIDRTSATKEKTGVKLEGITAINPANGEEVPVFIADYVLASYGTGAVMAVPAHDERDWDFAKKYDLPIKKVIESPSDFPANQAYCGEGLVVNSISWADGLLNIDAAKEIVEELEHRGLAKFVIKYKLRDWVFSRQRYWGEPIPMIHCEKCGLVPVPEKDLPVELPKVKSYEPTGTGESPLADITKWVNVKCPKCGSKGKRETNTMPQWAGSSWYYLRYLDPKNKKVLVDKKTDAYWSPVDMYVGGTEHATRHLIYARFWHKFLFDIGAVNYQEPFTQLKNQGLILGSDGRKMSKRWGNVINPDDMIANYGADTLRVYEMFMGPFEQGASWSTDSMIGSRRFLDRVWKLAGKIGKVKTNEAVENTLHKAIKKVGEDIDQFAFNTAISTMMVLSNEMDKLEVIDKKTFEDFLRILAPFAPHLTEELWSNFGHKKSIHLEKWPVCDECKMQDKMTTIVIQINGKVRDSFEIETGTSQSEVEKIALDREIVKKWIEGKDVKKIIYVREKLLNIVV